MADATLRKYAVHFANNDASSNNNNTNPGHHLSSLSHLANSALVNPLTSVTATNAVEWAETMILEYLDGQLEHLLDDDSLHLDPPHRNPSSPAGKKASGLLKRAMLSAWAQEEATMGRTPTNTTRVSNTPLEEALTMPPPTLAGLLKAVYRVQRGEESTANSSNRNSFTSGTNTTSTCTTCDYKGGPCGYVFCRGDIAWNCRTCQSDATCVLCDDCFRESDLEGHEVFFHRTTPGGCCDCGNLEAWNVDGMCPRHRPEVEDAGEEEEEEGVSGGNEDDFEAVRASQRTRLEHERHVDGTPTSSTSTAEPQPLPPRLAAALATVIGATIQSILTGAEGSAIGADVGQWRLRWADEICKIWNGAAEDKEYYRRGTVWMGKIVSKAEGTGKEDFLKKTITKVLHRSEVLNKGYDIHRCGSIGGGNVVIDC